MYALFLEIKQENLFSKKNKTWFLDKTLSLRALQCPRNQGDLRCGGGVESMDLVIEEK